MTTFVLSNSDRGYADEATAWNLKATRNAKYVQFGHTSALDMQQAIELVFDLEFFLETFPPAQHWPDVPDLLKRLKAFCEPLLVTQNNTLETQP